MILVYLLLVTHVLSRGCVDSGSNTGWGDICSTKITKEICEANSVFLDGVYYGNIDYYCCATCEKFSCKPYTEETCKKVAARLGLQLGGGGYSFAASDYGAKGCYTYDSGSYKGYVFYGRGGSTSQQRATSLWGGRVRPTGWDCASTSEEEAVAKYVAWSYGDSTTKRDRPYMGPKAMAEAKVGLNCMGGRCDHWRGAEEAVAKYVAWSYGDSTTKRDRPYMGPKAMAKAKTEQAAEDAVGEGMVDYHAVKRIKWEFAQKGCLPSPYKTHGEGYNVYNCAKKCRNDPSCKQFSMKGSKCWTTSNDYIVKCGGWFATNEDVYRILDAAEEAVGDCYKNCMGKYQDPDHCNRNCPETGEFMAMSETNESVGMSKVVQALALVGSLAIIYGAGCHYLKAQ